jgi:hypothetical protein
MHINSHGSFLLGLVCVLFTIQRSSSSLIDDGRHDYFCRQNDKKSIENFEMIIAIHCF